MDSYTHLLHSVVPASYALRLVFRDCSAGAKFSGAVDIKLELLRPSVVVELHAKDIIVLRAIATTADGNHVKMTKAVVQDEAESVQLHFPVEMCGAVTLSCEYEGTVSKALRGVYHCTFEEGIAGLSTHFEPVYARYCMPCVDEPKAKAAFQITIVAPTVLTVVSNMPEIEHKPSPGNGEGLTEHIFDTTPRMSTYLVGFSVGDYASIHLPDGAAPVRMSLYAQRGKEQLGKVALDIAAKSLVFFEEFFDQKFPLPKLDLVVPPAFPIGGMENWGMITLTNRALIDEDSSLNRKGMVARLVSHEVSHMWFGDLVTPCWWDDLWLKEGFASWVNLLPLDREYPDWRVWDHWALDLLYAGVVGRAGALEVDQYQATHAIEVPVNHPSEIQEIFDALSYNKGSCVVNMLFHFLGSDAFRQGLSKWLDVFKNSNSTTKDLWACLAEASGKPVEQIMATWTRQEGFPFLSVSHAADGRWSISQQRFTLKAVVPETEEPASKRQRGSLWTVPLLVLHGSQAAPEQLLFEGDTVEVAVRSEWVLLNAGARTPLRVHYSPDLLRALAGEAARPGSVLGPLDRVALISDGFAMLRAGLHEPDTVLQLFNDLLSVERDPLVWSGAVGILDLLLKVFSDSAPTIRQFVANLVAPQYSRLGWNALQDEPHDDTLLRPSMLAVLGQCQNEEVLKESHRRCEAYLCSAHEPVPMADAGPKVSMTRAWKSVCPACGGLEKPEAGVRGVAMRIAVEHDPLLWDRMVKRQTAAQASEERDQLLIALMGHQSRDAVESWVAHALGGKLASQEWTTLFAGLANNRHHKGLAWDLLVRHWETVYDAWGQSQFRMKAIVVSAMSSCRDAATAKAFFDCHRCDVAKSTIKQQLEAMAADLALKGRNRDVERYLFNLPACA